MSLGRVPYIYAPIEAIGCWFLHYLDTDTGTASTVALGLDSQHPRENGVSARPVTHRLSAGVLGDV